MCTSGHHDDNICIAVFAEIKYPLNELPIFLVQTLQVLLFCLLYLDLGLTIPFP